MASTAPEQGRRGNDKPVSDAATIDADELTHLARIARDPADVYPLLLPTADQEQAHRAAIVERVADLIDNFVSLEFNAVSKVLRSVAAVGRNSLRLVSYSEFHSENVQDPFKSAESDLLRKAMFHYQPLQHIQKPEWFEADPVGSLSFIKGVQQTVTEPYHFFTFGPDGCEAILNATVDEIFRRDKQKWLTEAHQLAKKAVANSRGEDDGVLGRNVSANKLSPELSRDVTLIPLLFGEDVKHIDLKRKPINPEQQTPTMRVPLSLFPFLAEKFSNTQLSLELCGHVHGYKRTPGCGLYHYGRSVLWGLRISWRK
jgi:hypothetical protein